MRVQLVDKDAADAQKVETGEVLLRVLRNARRNVRPCAILGPKRRPAHAPSQDMHGVSFVDGFASATTDGAEASSSLLVGQ